MSSDQPRFNTSPSSNLCFAEYTNTKYGIQHDSSLIVEPENRKTPLHRPINWQKICTSIEGEIYKEAEIPENGVVLSFTTMALAHVHGRRITTANLGDSRVTLFTFNPQTRHISAMALTLDQANGSPSEAKRALAYPNITLDPQTNVFTETINIGGNQIPVSAGPTGGLGNRFSGAWFRRSPEIHHFKCAGENLLRFVVVETDGTHCGWRTQDRATYLQQYIDQQPDLKITASELSSHFVKTALAMGSQDNMSVMVRELDGQGACVMAAFDGADKQGFVFSQAAARLMEKHLQKPPRDWSKTAENIIPLFDLSIDLP